MRLRAICGGWRRGWIRKGWGSRRRWGCFRWGGWGRRRTSNATMAYDLEDGLVAVRF